MLNRALNMVVISILSTAHDDAVGFTHHCQTGRRTKLKLSNLHPPSRCREVGKKVFHFLIKHIEARSSALVRHIVGPE